MKSAPNEATITLRNVTFCLVDMVLNGSEEKNAILLFCLQRSVAGKLSLSQPSWYV